jgi:hypothetical protein
MAMQMLEKRTQANGLDQQAKWQAKMATYRAKTGGNLTARIDANYPPQ